MKRIAAPIDNKNILEDGLDEIIEDLYEAPDHYKGGHRHKVGFLNLKDNNDDLICEAYVDVSWIFGDNTVKIEILAFNEYVNYLEETVREVFNHYTSFFKSWENDVNEGLQVEFNETYGSTPILSVRFYFEYND